MKIYQREFRPVNPVTLWYGSLGHISSLNELYKSSHQKANREVLDIVWNLQSLNMHNKDLKERLTTIKDVEMRPCRFTRANLQ